MKFAAVSNSAYSSSISTKIIKSFKKYFPEAEYDNFVRFQSDIDGVLLPHSAKPGNYVDRLWNRLIHYTLGNDMRLTTSLPVLGRSFIPSKLNQYDLIHFHWIGGRTLDYSRLGSLSSPVIYTLHDMYPCTGICHHSFECDSYERGCYNCPQIKNPALKKWFAQKMFSYKKKCFSKIPKLTIVTPSAWLKKIVKRSHMFEGRRIEHIFNPLNTELFCPGNQQEGRCRFGLKNDSFVLLFVASSVYSPYKGVNFLMDSLWEMKRRGIKNVELLIVGNQSNSIEYPYPCIYTGHIKEQVDMALAYRASDVYVCPSKADNSPGTCMEAQACGIPGVAFDIGGIPEIITHGQSGFISPCFDIRNIVDNIQLLFNSQPLKEKMGTLARSLAVDRFEEKMITQKYYEIYKEMCAFKRK